MSEGPGKNPPQKPPSKDGRGWLGAAGPLDLPPPSPGCLAPFYIDPANHGRPIPTAIAEAMLASPRGRPVVKISCGRCVKCAITRKNMLIGRMAAEAATCRKVLLLTLTYADIMQPDGTKEPNPDAKALNPEHIRKFRRSMIKRYGATSDPTRKLSMVLAGEYGEKRQRAHFHVLLYFPGAMSSDELPEWASIPEMGYHARWLARQNGAKETDAFKCCGLTIKADGGDILLPSGDIRRRPVRYRVLDFPGWEHGHVNVLTPTFGAFRYVAKYLLKQEHAEKTNSNHDKNSQSFGLWSKNLGVRYIESYGRDVARQGLQPHDTTYSVPGGVYTRGPMKGRHVRYTMTRTMRREYLNAMMRETAHMLASGAQKTFEAKTDVLINHIDRDAKADPAFSAMQVTSKLLTRHRPAVWWQHTMPPAMEARKLPCGGYIVKTARGQVFLTYYHHGVINGRVAFCYPLENKSQVERARILGGYAALGGYPEDYSFTSRQLAAAQRASPRVWTEHKTLIFPILFSPARANELWHKRIYGLADEWSKQSLGEIKHANYGLPMTWDATKITVDDPRRFPMWNRWLTEGMAK